MWEFVRILGLVLKKIEKKKFARAWAEAAQRSPEETKRIAERFQGHSLYHFQLSPRAADVRKALAEFGVCIPFIDILEDSKAANELLSKGGKDQVPCLKIENSGGDSRWMYESRDIITYLKQRVEHG